MWRFSVCCLNFEVAAAMLLSSFLLPKYICYWNSKVWRYDNRNAKDILINIIMARKLCWMMHVACGYLVTKALLTFQNCWYGFHKAIIVWEEDLWRWWNDNRYASGPGLRHLKCADLKQILKIVLMAAVAALENAKIFFRNLNISPAHWQSNI